MFCGKCGKELNDDASFCSSCGKPVTQESEPVTQPAEETDLTAQSDQRIAQKSFQGMMPANDDIQPKTSGMAIAGMILGILGFLSAGITSIPGLVFSIIGLVQVNNSKRMLRGQGMAIAGVICAGLSIFIMPALLFPVFMHARETAKQTGCLSNVKQISTAILMYSSDWDEQYPFKDNWIDSLEPYTKNRTIFNCPELQQGEGGYAFTSAMSGTRNDFASDAAIEAMIFESRPGLNVSGGQGDMEARHSGGLIIGYADGHCKWDKLEALQGSDLVKWMPNVSAPKSGGSPPSPPATGFLGH